MLKRMMLASVAAAVLALPAMAQDTPTRDSVVATVDGHEITLGQMITAASRLPEQYRQLPANVLFDGVLNQLIQQQLLAETVEEAPARIEITLANERRSLLAGAAIQILAEAAVTDEAIQAKYDEMFGAENAQTEYNAAHILVATMEEAEALKARIEAGEDFATLAQELSTDTGSGANGGELGWFTRGMMVEPFEAAVVEMEPGTLAGPVETQFGWHVIRLNETRMQAAPPIGQVRDAIIEELQSGAIEGRIAELEAGAEITRPAEGAFDPALIGNLDLLED